MNTGIDQYMDIFKDAVEDSAAKLTISFEKILIEVIILFMVIPRKINFTQMGRYVSLAKRFFGKQGLIPVTSAKLVRRNVSSHLGPSCVR